MVSKRVKHIKLLVRARLTRHISKGMWVPQGIADWELYVFSQNFQKMNNIEFTKDLIKGRIAETIFEQMFRESGKFTILRFGYEYTLPEIAQYQHLAEIQAVLKNIRNAPDFVLVSQDKKEVYLVEVKYRNVRIPHEIESIAEEILKTWNPAWLFVASSDGFFFEPCNTIVRNKGKIGRLFETAISATSQVQYLDLLREFERK